MTLTACTKNETTQPETKTDVPVAETTAPEVSMTYPPYLTALGSPDSENDFLFEVIDLDGNKKQFLVYTDEELLSDALSASEMIKLNEYTGVTEAVNGFEAIYNRDGMHWVLYINGEMTEKLCTEIKIENGNSYSFRLER